jgi:glycosyltransferase involved in cell wall biosynthesis
MSAADRSLQIALLSYRGNMFCGGQGVYLTNLARSLIGRGHRVRVMAGPPYPDPVPGAEMELMPDENFINKPASSLPAHGPWAIFSPLNLLEYGLARAGANPEMLAFSLRSFVRLRRLAQAREVDVVHDNQGLGYGLLLLRTLGLPVVATIHHPLQVDRAEDIRQMQGLGPRIKRSLYYPIIMQKLVAQRLDRVIAVSALARDLVAEAYGLDPERMAVVPNGVDSALFAPRAGVEREDGRLLFVGSTEDRKKGVIYLLEALAALPPRFRLTIVDGRMYPGRVFAKDAVKRLALDSRVEFKGRISNDELALEYNRAEMAVMPSLFEGFGLPALEAMASGAPLICAAAGALPEVAGPDGALLVKPRSAEAIRVAVLQLDSDPARRRELSLAGRKRALDNFSWEKAAEKMEEQYRIAIANRKRNRLSASELASGPDPGFKWET